MWNKIDSYVGNEEEKMVLFWGCQQEVWEWDGALSFVFATHPLFRPFLVQ